MPPSTRSGGKSAPERIYHSTPSLTQARFPPRKKAVRTYGKGTPGGKKWNQQTLTQIDFVASAGLVDKDDDEDVNVEDQENQEEADEYEIPNNDGHMAKKMGKGKEKEVVGPALKKGHLMTEMVEDQPRPSATKRQAKKEVSIQEPDDDENLVISTVKRRTNRNQSNKENQEPADELPSNFRKRRAPSKQNDTKSARNKRRRTLGDSPTPSAQNQAKGSRRRTFGDPPSSSSKYRTQTLTQIYPKGRFIKDSEDEGDGFDDWAQLTPQKPQESKTQPEPAIPEAVQEPCHPCVVPQTPAKRIRFEIPSSSQLSTPMHSSMLARYGPGDKVHDSPSKGVAVGYEISELPGPATRRNMVIEDSFATESWVSTPFKRTPLKDITSAAAESPTLSRLREGLVDIRKAGEIESPSRGRLSKESSIVSEAMSTPTKPRRGKSTELGRGSPSPMKILKTTPSPSKNAGTSSRLKKRRSPMKTTGGLYEIPDSDEDDEAFWGEEEGELEDDGDTVKGAESPAVEVKPEDLDESRDHDEGESQSQDSVHFEIDAEEHHEPGVIDDTEDKFFYKQNNIHIDSESVVQYESNCREAKDGADSGKLAHLEADVKREVFMIEDSDEEGEGDEDDGDFLAGAETQFAFDEFTTSLEQSDKLRPTLELIEEEPLSTAGSSRRLQPSSRTRQATSSITSTHPLSSPQLPKISGPQGLIREPTPPPATRIRKPINHRLTSSQAAESQRVPLSIIQALGQPSYRTDVLLPVHPTSIKYLVSGHTIHISLPFSIPAQVARFWLFDGDLLRYAALTGPSVAKGHDKWTYNVGQMYELNNPRDEEDLREEEFLEGPLGNYHYFPPVIACRLMANLKHAVFNGNYNEDFEETQQEDLLSDFDEPIVRPKTPAGSFTVSQQVEAQLLSETTAQYSEPLDEILVPSTPDQEKTPRPPIPRSLSRTPATPIRRSARLSQSRAAAPSSQSQANSVRPSQATTASQASTPEKAQQSSIRSSSSHLTFQDYGSSSPLFVPPGVVSVNSSQLLTKSQMLPDSLLRDDDMVPPEIWDSQEE